MMLPSACPTAASPFWFMLFFLLFFFLSLMGDDWLGSFPPNEPAVASRASDIWRKHNKTYMTELFSVAAELRLHPVSEPAMVAERFHSLRYVPTLCALVDNEEGQRWSPRSPPWGDKPPDRSSATTERVAGHNWGTDEERESEVFMYNRPCFYDLSG